MTEENQTSGKRKTRLLSQICQQKIKNLNIGHRKKNLHKETNTKKTEGRVIKKSNNRKS